MISRLFRSFGAGWLQVIDKRNLARFGQTAREMPQAY